MSVTRKKIEAYAQLAALDLDRASPAELEAAYDRALTLLPSRAPIYTATTKIAPKERVAGALRTFEIYEWRLRSLYRPRLAALKRMFEGRERCFVIGNGPSLNRTDLSMLKDEVTFAVNSFFLKVPELDWLPTFFVVEDHLVAEDRAAWINALEGPTKLFPAYLGYCLPEGPDTIFFNHRPRKSYPHGFDFSEDASEITYTGCTVTFTVLQLAHYLGFKAVHLIGVDADYVLPADVAQSKDYGVGILDMASNDPNHFHPDYFGKGFRWHDPQVDKMIEAYGEARRVTDALGRPIVNSGIGGKLDVFERVPYAAALPGARAPEAVETANAAAAARRPAGEGMIAPADLAALCRARLGRDGRSGRALGRGWGGASATGFPRVLVVDFTPIGDASATGQLKAALLGDWPEGERMEIAAIGDTLTLAGGGLAAPLAAGPGERPDALVDAAIAFAPDVVLYRPVAEKVRLHRLLVDILALRPAPTLLWFMDDWMLRLARQDGAAFDAFDSGLSILMEAAPFALAISDPMAELLEARYGLPARAVANGIAPAAFRAAREAAAARREPGGTGLRVRYAGSLAGDMGLDSLLAVAGAVERLAGEGATFEIRTRDYWQRLAGSAFEGFAATRLVTGELSPEAYRGWLAEADVLVVAYNFDEETLRYVRHSLANKLPECLASGAVVLAVGPAEIATIARLRGAGCGVVVDAPGAGPVEAALRGLFDPARRAALAAAGIALAEAEFDLLAQRERLRAALLEAARTALPADLSPRLARDTLTASWPRAPLEALSFLPSLAG